jgi:hypothetical protein
LLTLIIFAQLSKNAQEEKDKRPAIKTFFLTMEKNSNQGDW